MNQSFDMGFFAEEIPEKLYFAGREISFDEKYFRYAAAKAEFAPVIRETVQKMRNNFEEKIGDLPNFVTKGYSWAREEISPLLSIAKKQLALHGAYGLSEDDFFKNYIEPKFIDFPVIYEQMTDAYSAIQQEQEAKNAARVAERKLNVAAGSSNLGEMLWNGVRRAGDEVVNIANYTIIYNDDIKNKIKDDFIYVCYTITDLFAEALYDSEKLDLRNPVSLNDIKRSATILKNLQEGCIPEAKINDAAFEVFSLHPYQRGFLEWATSHYGDADGHLQKIADAFHVNIRSTKEKLLNAAFEAVDFSSEESTLNSQKNYLEKESWLGISNEKNQKQIAIKLQYFDLQFRTVDGTEYATREDAEKAKKLIQFFKELDLSSEEAINNSKKLFLEEEQNLGMTIPALEQKIEKMLADADKAARSNDGVEYSSREDAKIAQDQSKALKDFLDTVNFDSLDDIRALEKKIKDPAFIIPAAHELQNRIQNYLEMAKYFSPAKFATIRFLLTPKIKVISTIIVFFLIGGISSASSDLGGFLVLVFFAYIISHFFTTKKRFLKKAEAYLQQKNYKKAARYYQLANMKAKDYLLQNGK